MRRRTLKSFLFLYGGGDTSQSESERAAGMAAWKAWIAELGEAVVVGGNAFTQAKTITSNGSVSDGPAGMMATGYSLVQAETLDDAVEMARGCPLHLGGGHLTVYETFEVV